MRQPIIFEWKCSVLGKLLADTGWQAERGHAALLGLEQFLQMSNEATEPLVPSPAIDAAWHAFLLHTQEYADYCDDQFGRFVHHRPCSTNRPSRSKGTYSRTRRLAEEHFGPLDEVAWPIMAAGVDCDSMRSIDCDSMVSS